MLQLSNAVDDSPSDEHILVPRLPQLARMNRFQTLFDRCAIWLTDFGSADYLSDEVHPRQRIDLQPVFATSVQRSSHQIPIGDLA